jgi:DNA-binding NtrC family response regulator
MGQTVLIIGDHERTPELLRHILSELRLEAEVIVARSPKQAVEQAKKKQLIPDVVIADMLMAEMSGLELACLWPLVAPYSKFILITDAYSDLIEEASRRLQIHHYLVRPFSYYKLREIVLAALKNSAAEKRLWGGNPTSEGLAPL